MQPGHVLLLLSLAATACAGRAIHEPLAAQQGAAQAPTTNRAGARLGPPSPCGLGLRRIDRPIVRQAPLALY
ncbi:MAG TPA: hypothetical protein VFK05_20845 [Polyangiaceae bacterium]|nr:hypothetical protein [Polyangiaceae bacterium]